MPYFTHALCLASLLSSILYEGLNRAPHFATGRKLKHVSAPVVIIHSVEDNYIPFLQAGKLFDCASDPKYMLKITGSHLDTADGHEAALSAMMGHLAL